MIIIIFFYKLITLKWSESALVSLFGLMLSPPDDRITQAMAYVARLATPVAAYLVPNNMLPV